MTGFDGITGALAARLMATLNADMERAALRLVEPLDGERFLVVGFGPGVGLELLLDAAAPASVLGLDPSAAMLQAARRRIARHPRRGASIELRRGRAADLMAEGTFDAAIAVNCEQFFDPHARSIRAIAGALRPGGRLASLTHRWAIERRHPVREWKALVEADLTDAGLGAPVWIEDRFRSGPALGYLARSSAHP